MSCLVSRHRRDRRGRFGVPPAARMSGLRARLFAPTRQLSRPRSGTQDRLFFKPRGMRNSLSLNRFFLLKVRTKDRLFFKPRGMRNSLSFHQIFLA